VFSSNFQWHILSRVKQILKFYKLGKGSKYTVFSMKGIIEIGKKSWTFLVFTLYKQVGLGDFFFKFVISSILKIQSSIWCD